MTFQTFALRTLYLLLLGLGLAALWRFRDIWLLVFLAVVIAVGISIPVGYLQRLGVPRPLAVALAAFGLLFVTLELSLWFVPLVVTDLSELLNRLPDFADRFLQLYGQWRAQAEWRSVLLPPITLPADGSELSAEQLQRVLSDATRSGLPILASGGGFVASLFVNLFLVVMLSIFFVAEPKVYVRASLYLVPQRQHHKLLALWSACYYTLKTWLLTLLLSISLTVALVWLVLGALGMPNILVVAVFAGVATFVPNIGVFLPLVPITAFALLTDPDRLLLFVLSYLAIQLVESNVLMPALIRRQLSIPPAATLTFQIIMGFVSGVVGILLAVPLLAVGIVLVRELYSFDFLKLRGRDLGVSLPPPALPPRDAQVLRWLRAQWSRFRDREGGNKRS